MTLIRTRHLLRLLAAVTVLTLLLGACGVFGSASAASVNGRDIGETDLQDELSAIRDNAQYRQALESGFGGSLLGQSEGTFNAVFAARVLTLQIYYELAGQYLTDKHIDITRDMLDAARQDAVAQAGGQEVFQRFPERYRDLIVRRRAVVVALDEELGRDFRRPGAVEQYFQQHADQFEQLCASHILVGSKEKAAELRSRIEAGADFAELARQESTDTASAQQGGDLGCRTAGTFVPEFEDAAAKVPVGQVSPPVQTAFGWHLILVRERRQPSLDEVRSDVEQRLATLAQDAFNQWLADAAADADIDVNPRYGTWSSRSVEGSEGSELFEVVPPEGPSTTVARLPGAPQG